MKKTIFILIITVTVLFADNTSVMDGYSKDPLKNRVFSYDYVVTQTISINNYLNTNLNNLDKNAKRNITEDIYYLISSSISESYKQDKLIIAKKDDLILKTLFQSAQRLNVLGSNLAYYQLFQMNNTDKLQSIYFTKDLQLSLTYDLFKLEDKFWSIKFPYYFMIRKIQKSRIKNIESTIISISTGGAKDKSKLGYSQASITLFVSDKQNNKGFFEYWYKVFKVDSKIQLKPTGIKNYKTQYIKDKLINNEITSWSTDTNSFIAIYTGLDGTYEVNRQHFLDFLNQIKEKS